MQLSPSIPAHTAIIVAVVHIKLSEASVTVTVLSDLMHGIGIRLHALIHTPNSQSKGHNAVICNTARNSHPHFTVLR